MNLQMSYNYMKYPNYVMDDEIVFVAQTNCDRN